MKDLKPLIKSKVKYQQKEDLMEIFSAGLIFVGVFVWLLFTLI